MTFYTVFPDPPASYCWQFKDDPEAALHYQQIIEYRHGWCCVIWEWPEEARESDPPPLATGGPTGRSRPLPAMTIVTTHYRYKRPPRKRKAVSWPMGAAQGSMAEGMKEGRKNGWHH